MTVEEMLERMSEREWEEWQAYDRISPIGDQRLVRQVALIACTLANIHRGNREAFDLDDFDLYRDPPRPLTRSEEEQRFLQSFAARGLLVNRGEG